MDEESISEYRKSHLLMKPPPIDASHDTLRHRSNMYGRLPGAWTFRPHEIQQAGPTKIRVVVVHYMVLHITYLSSTVRYQSAPRSSLVVTQQLPLRLPLTGHGRRHMNILKPTRPPPRQDAHQNHFRPLFSPDILSESTSIGRSSDITKRHISLSKDPM